MKTLILSYAFMLSTYAIAEVTCVTIGNTQHCNNGYSETNTGGGYIFQNNGGVRIENGNGYQIRLGAPYAPNPSPVIPVQPKSSENVFSGFADGLNQGF